jgi:chromosome partitioning protein
VPAPPEGLAVRAMRQMFETIRLVREQANPFLTIMGVIPTMYDRRWPEHRAFLEEMQRECEEAGVRLFAPIARRQSYLYLSTRGQDYKPVAEAIATAVHEHKQAGQLVGAVSA